MGLHSGSVSRHTDINGQTAFSGNGIIVAQRVMDFGSSGHVLLSRAFAEIAGDFEEFGPHLFELGPMKDKHGQEIWIYNFNNGVAGRPWDMDSRSSRSSENLRPYWLTAQREAPRDQIGGAVPRIQGFTWCVKLTNSSTG